MSYAAGIERNKRMISAEPTARYSNGITGWSVYEILSHG